MSVRYDIPPAVTLSGVEEIGRKVSWPDGEL